MRTFYGPYRALEEKFVPYLHSLHPGPERAVLVICPSGRVADYLRRQLVKQEGILSNVAFHTFSQVTAYLAQENPGTKLPLLPGDSLHDYVLKKLLSAPSFHRYPMSRGFVSALRASLRDLSDAQADPDVLQEHLQTTADSHLEAERAHLQWLIDVYRSYRQKLDQVPGFESYQKYFQRALSQVAHSRWLAHFSEVIVYGFYELTGRQLELFQAFQMQQEVTVFWPYAALEAFAFGRKFFEANIMGSSARLEALPTAGYPRAAGNSLPCLFTAQSVSQPPTNVQLISAPHAAGELFFVAKEILRLHEEQGVAFSDIAITARSLEAYKTLLPDVLSQHGIALQADFSFGLTSKPLGVFVLNLLSLARGGFDREDLLAIINAPYFKHSCQWRYLVEESLAKRDYTQWTDLIRPSLSHYDPAFLVWLERVKLTLERLEKSGKWDTLCTTVRQFLEDNIARDVLNAEEQAIWQQIQNSLDCFARYAAADERCQEREFLDECLEVLQALQFHQVYTVPSGVTVADVSSLRGLSFKVIFVLGMNEKSFPQVIREDPVLKDYYRYVLRDQLGFWLNPKMERFEEERQLFYGIADAARERLYLSFQRADEEGKPIVLSHYLTELARAAQLDLAAGALRWVPLHFYDRVQQVSPFYLTACEMSWKLAAEGRNEQAYEQAGLLTEQRGCSLRAARQLSSTGALTPRDGAVASGPAIFAQQNGGKGFSPSALQDLARCPLKYFFAKGLGLAEEKEVLSREELADNRRGTTYHEILKDYYQHLLEEGLNGQLFESALQEHLDRSFQAHCHPESYQHFGIYPVIWKLILRDMHDKLSDFVLKDAQHLGDYIPSIFETSFEQIYHPSEEIALKLQGIIDRIDLDPKHHTFFIVDYKSGRHGGKDLAAEMFKRVILQPFIYLILAQQATQTQGYAAAGAALLNINKGYARQELSADGFEAVKEKAAQFFSLLSQLIHQGQFGLIAGEHCEYCPYAGICRKDSFRARIRARHAPLAARLEEAKQ